MSSASSNIPRPRARGAVEGWEELIAKVISFINTLPEGNERAARMLKGSLRDIWFHFWHEANLPEDGRFATTDIDFVESNYGNIVALIEVKPYDRYPSDFQINTYAKIGGALGVPFYVVQFDPSARERPFIIHSYKSGSTAKHEVMELNTTAELIEFYHFIRGL